LSRFAPRWARILFNGVLFGVFLAFLVLVFLIPTSRAMSWRETPCRILSSDVETKESTGRKKRSTPYMHRARVSFRYEFGGKTYTSDRYDRIGDWSSDRHAEQELAARYRPGDTATCFVDPERKGEAVLTNPIWGSLLYAVFFVVTLGATLIFGFGLYCELRNWYPKWVTRRLKVNERPGAS
jgi:hypothetical protein